MTNTPVIGQTVEFVTNYPGHEGETAQGKVIDYREGAYARNPTVLTQFGQTEVLASWWGNRVKVVG